MSGKELNAESGDPIITIIVIIDHYRLSSHKRRQKAHKSTETQPSELIQVKEFSIAYVKWEKSDLVNLKRTKC